MVKETFDPRKHVELPEEKGGGFVAREALQAEVEAVKLAEITRVFKEGGLRPEDILHTEALEEDKERRKEMKFGEELLAKLQKLEIDGSEFLKELARSKTLRGSKQFMLKTVVEDGDFLEEADPKLRSDPEVVLRAVENSGNALRFAEGEAKKDRRVVLRALRSNGYALEVADKEFRADKEAVLTAVRSVGTAISYASPELQKDREIVMEAVRSTPFVLRDIDPRFRLDKEIVMAAVSRDGEALEFVGWDNKLARDLDVIGAAIRNNPRALMWAHPEIKRKIQQSLGITDEMIRKEREREFGRAAGLEK